MEATAKRRLALLGSGLLLAAVVTTLLQIYLVRRGIVAAEPYSVAVGLGVAMPLLLASAYPLTGENVGSQRTRVGLVVAESTFGTAFGVAAVALLVAVDLPNMLPVGGGAAATYLGGVTARALVLGRLATTEQESTA